MTAGAKICGIKTDAALDAALEGGARYIGLVFFGKSPRNVDIATAARLAARARGHAKVVALVVDADDEELGEIIDAVSPDMIQLHGHETPERVAGIAKLFQLPLIKAIAVGTRDDTVRALDYVSAARLILFDAKPPKEPDALPGGNGLVFDWNMIAEVSDRVPFMLSGGLTPDNVAAAIRQTGAHAVDVSSGVESAPGVKDPELIRRFLHAVKTAKQFP
ncbi:MAG: phosphoribosylanthranilate isomerase [Hyphomicrobium sp.]|nr:phosphoribosylanthranilate isomerase [Hyphomicrobium sp.]